MAGLLHWRLHAPLSRFYRIVSTRQKPPIPCHLLSSESAFSYSNLGASSSWHATGHCPTLVPFKRRTVGVGLQQCRYKFTYTAVSRRSARSLRSVKKPSFEELGGNTHHDQEDLREYTEREGGNDFGIALSNGNQRSDEEKEEEDRDGDNALLGYQCRVAPVEVHFGNTILDIDVPVLIDRQKMEQGDLREGIENESESGGGYEDHVDEGQKLGMEEVYTYGDLLSAVAPALRIPPEDLEKYQVRGMGQGDGHHGRLHATHTPVICSGGRGRGQLRFMIVRADGDSEREGTERLLAMIENLADLSEPHRYFPTARSMKRKFILHIGPTNSGKTHSALQALAAAPSGVYCGPLRLLANEVYERMNANGVQCQLLTGQQHLPPVSSRREMVGANGVQEERTGRERMNVKGKKRKSASGTVSGSKWNQDLENSLSFAEECASNDSGRPLLTHALTSEVVEEGVDDYSTHTSCTIEMANLRRKVDVAVIDEVQMMASPDRGWAWTRALLGVPAREVHVCGSVSAFKLVKKLLDRMGEEYKEMRYERLSPLQVEKHPINSKDLVQQLRHGDCIIAFSRKEIFRLKRLIDRETQGQVCCGVVYGALPPESRSQQAALFNEVGNRCAVLVASDAVGMGLNLNIRRIVFSTTVKFDGIEERSLTSQEIKQIAGRAGRYKSQYPSGLVTTMDKRAQSLVRRALRTDDEYVAAAGLVPTYEQLETMHGYTRGRASLQELISLFHDHSVLGEDYFLCESEDMLQLASWLEDIPLEFKDRYVLCIAPVDINRPLQMAAIRKWAEVLARGELVRFFHGAGKLPTAHSLSETHLRAIEDRHAIADIYLWLSNRSSHFPDRQRAENLQKECIQLIDSTLYDPMSGRMISKQMKQKARSEGRKQKHARRMGKSELRKYM